MALIIGIFIGLVLGLTGAGGSVFAVPLLIWILDLSAQQAIGISLGAVAVGAFFGAFTRFRSGEIQWLPALVYASIGSAIAPIGSWINRHSDGVYLMTGFSFLVLIIAARMWKQANQHPQETVIVRAGNIDSVTENSAICRVNNGEKFKIGLPCILGVSGGAVLTGLLSGLFGVGGGFLIVPTLLFLTGISIQQAVATSLVVIAAISSVGFFSFIMAGSIVNFSMLGQVAMGGVIGMAIGTFVSRYVAGPVLQKMFASLMLVMAILMIFTQLV